MKKALIIAVSALAVAACKTKNTATTDNPTSSTTYTTSSSKAFFPEASITKKFMKDFPNARKIVWSKEDNSYYAKFLNNGFPSDATYGYDGKILMSNIGMDVNKLPVLAKNYLNTKYPNNTISGVMKMRDGIRETGKILVDLHNGESLVFDKDGTFIGTK